MTTDPTYTKLLSLVCQEPEEHHHKVVLSDWLEEQGEPELAEAYAWMASEGKAPRVPTDEVYYQELGIYCYWLKETLGWREFGTAHHIPEEIFACLQVNTELSHEGRGNWYSTRADAYEAAATAYVEARRTGWRPEVRTP